MQKVYWEDLADKINSLVESYGVVSEENLQLGLNRKARIQMLKHILTHKEFSHEIIKKFLLKTAEINPATDKGAGLSHYASLDKNLLCSVVADKRIMLIDSEKKVLMAIIDSSSAYMQECYENIVNDYYDYEIYFISFVANGLKLEFDKKVWFEVSYAVLGEIVTEYLDKELDYGSKLVFLAASEFLSQKESSNEKLKSLCEEIWREPKSRKALDVLVLHRRTDFDRFVELFLKEFELLHGEFIKTNVRGLISRELCADVESSSVELIVMRFFDSLYVDFSFNDQWVLPERKDKFYELSQKLLNEKNNITLHVKQSDFDNMCFEEVSQCYIDKTKEGIKSFERVVSDVLIVK